MKKVCRGNQWSMKRERNPKNPRSTFHCFSVEGEIILVLPFVSGLKVIIRAIVRQSKAHHDSYIRAGQESKVQCIAKHVFLTI